MAIQRRITADGTPRYLAKCYIGRDPDTKKRREVFRTFCTLKGARTWEATQRKALATGTFVQPSQTRLGDYLRQWLEGPAKLTAKRERTRRDYRLLLDRYVMPFDLALVPLARLTTPLLEAHYGLLRERGTNGRPLSDRTVRLVHRIVHAALERARKGKLLAANSASDVELGQEEREHQPHVLTVPQMCALLTASRGNRFHALWHVLLHGGLRPSEALGLQWQDVLADGVRVRQALVTNLKAGWQLLLPKTKQSKREVKLPEEAMAALAEHRARQEIERIAKGSGYQDHGLVFGNQNGGPVDLRNLAARHWRPLLKATGLPPLRLYDCRHTHASHALAAGVPITAVAARLGHANPRVTLGCYAHLLDGQETEAMARIARYVATAGFGLSQ